MSNIGRKIELLANVAIIVVAVLLSATLVKNYLVAGPAPVRESNPRRAPASSLIGEKVNLPDVDWQKNERTLILAISTSCHFCTDSAPFYKRLVAERGATRVVAVLPQSAGEGRDYLSKHGVAVDEVRQAGLDSLGVTGTPTIIMADKEGKVSSVWFGRLPPEKEREVLNQVH
jgi:thioredoxin-related protein